MKIKRTHLSAALLVGILAVCGNHRADAAITGISSVVAGTPGSPPYLLESLTVGGYTVGSNELAVGTVEAQPGGNDGGTFFNTWPPPFDPPAPPSTLDINQLLARNNNPNPVIVRDFGGGNWVDANGANPDFFIIEAAAGGNVDGDVMVQAILPGDVLGMPVALPSASWAAIGFNRVGNPNNNQPLKGIAFSVTDLLDAGGAPLPQSATLAGLQLTSSGLDPSLIAAVTGQALTPTIENIQPANGTSFADPAQGIRFNVTSPEAIPSANISLTVNGTEVTPTFTGGGTAWSANFGPLELNTVYTAAITARNSAGEASVTIGFDTFSQDNPIIEAEDFNFDGGQFIDHPVLCNTVGGAPNCYFDKVGLPDIDTHETGGADDNSFDFANIYRWGPDVDRVENVDTFTSADQPLRDKFANAPAGDQGPIKDYDVTEIDAGDWLNYTRTFSNAVYTVYLRVRSSAAQSVSLGRVSNPTSPAQTVGTLGTFNVPSTSGGYVLVPLTDVAGDEVPVALSGVVTLRLTADDANADIQWNFLMFVPRPGGPVPAFIGDVAPADGAAGVPPNATVRVEIVNASTSVQVNTVVLTVNGQNVTAQSTLTPGPAGLTVEYAPGFLPGGTNTASITFQDDQANSIASEWQFIVLSVPTLPASWAVSLGSVANRGFSVRTVQSTDTNVTANLARNIQTGEAQLAGVIPVDHEATDTPLLVNYTERADIADQGFFTTASGFPDRISQSVGLIASDNHEHHATEVLFYLPLQPGYIQLGANVNDGLRFSVGRGAGTGPDAYPLILAERPGEGVATADQPQFPANFIVSQAGVYAFRVVWVEHVGSSSLEIHVKDSDGDSHLLNDDNLVNGKPSPIQAFRTRTQAPPVPPPATLSLARNPDQTVTISWTGTGILQSAPSVTGPWSFVSGQTNPLTIPLAQTTFYRVVE